MYNSTIKHSSWHGSVVNTKATPRNEKKIHYVYLSTRVFPLGCISRTPQWER